MLLGIRSETGTSAVARPQPSQSPITITKAPNHEAASRLHIALTPKITHSKSYSHSMPPARRRSPMPVSATARTRTSLATM